MTLGIESGPENVRWLVVDDRGRTVAQSANFVAADFPASWQPTKWLKDPPGGATFGMTGDWRLATRRLDAQKAEQHDAEDHEASTLGLIAFISARPAMASIRELGIALAALSGLFWAFCATVGNWLCHRAAARSSAWPPLPGRRRPRI